MRAEVPWRFLLEGNDVFRRIVGLACAVGVLLVVVFHAARWRRSQRAPSRPPASPHGVAADYIGAQTCRECHPGHAERHQRTPHAATFSAAIDTEFAARLCGTTVDAGGDKPVRGYTIEETNPFLGLRGIRLSLARQDIFRAQVRALLRAAVHGQLKVMFPMISVASEYRAAEVIFREEALALGDAGIPHRIPPLGIMVEVPAVAIDPTPFLDVAKERTDDDEEHGRTRRQRRARRRISRGARAMRRGSMERSLWPSSGAGSLRVRCGR